MQIIWHGQFCFEILTTPAKNSQIKIVIDPFSEEMGLRVPKLEADILLFTRSDYSHNDIKVVSGISSVDSGKTPFLISGPGEYEIKNIFIQGIASLPFGTFSVNDKKGKEPLGNTIYTIEAENLKLCHLGNFNQKDLTEEQLEEIGEIDILMIPIGGVNTISAKEALKIMAQIEPKITIPMHYALPRLKIHPVKSREAGAKQFNGVKLDGLDKFLKSLGIKSIEPLPKFNIKQKDISAEEAKIVVLKP